MGTVPGKSCKENQNTHFTFSNTEKYSTAGKATDNNTTERMRFARCITKATDTHLRYVSLTVFPRQKVSPTRHFQLQFNVLELGPIPSRNTNWVGYVKSEATASLTGTVYD